MQQGIAALANGDCKTKKDAADKAGMSYWHFVRELSKPHIRVFMERRARENIASGMLRASYRINELVDAGSEHVSLDASKHLLSIAGIKPANDAQVSVNIELKAGFVIDISEQPKVIEHARPISNGSD